MIKIQTLIGQLKEEAQYKSDNMKNRRVYININPEEFKEVLLLNAKIEMAHRKINREFIIDDSNRDVLTQLYYYVVGSDNFEGNLNRGLMLSGNIGTGKTLMMNAVLKIITQLSNKMVTTLHSKNIESYLKEKGYDYLNQRPLFIDDIGKETKKINDFGTVRNTIPDLFANRYDLGSWTFATNNYSFDTLKEFYGETIVDRFKEMFNNLQLTGDSRRS